MKLSPSSCKWSMMSLHRSWSQSMDVFHAPYGLIGVKKESMAGSERGREGAAARKRLGWDLDEQRADESWGRRL